MTTWISLLRGINVGGKNILPMKDLRALLEGVGFEKVQTYIQSGNCVFEATGTEAGAISDAVAEAIEGRFGFRPAVLTLSADDFARAVEANPFANAADDPKSVHFFFLAEPASGADIDGLDALRAENERTGLTESVFYLHAPDGIGRSKLAAGAEKKLGVAVTARNLRSVLKLVDLAS